MYEEYKIDHRTFGGLIYPDDYAMYPEGHRMSEIAKRIASDLSFDHRNKRTYETLKEYRERMEEN